MDRLKGKVALITGGAGGCGLAASELFAAEGAKVAILDLPSSQGEAVAARINATGGQALFVAAGVSVADQVHRAVSQAQAHFGPITVLMNHAGIIAAGPFLETSEADWDRLMSVNVKSMFLVTKAVLPGMLAAGGGSVICTSSISAVVGTPMEVLYCTTKGACHMFARAQAAAMNSDHANRLATVIRSIGSDALGPAIDTALKGVVDFDMSCAYLFRFNQPALLVHDGYNQRVTERTLKAYLRGGYLLDPFYVACTNNHPTGLWRMSELAPDSFFASGFSILPDIHPCVSSHHGSLIEEIGFIVPVRPRTALVFSLMRGLHKGAFETDETQRLAALTPLIDAIFSQHLHLAHAEDLADPQDSDSQLEDAFVNILQGQLTETQRHVAKLILQGHSSQSISRALGISEGTVKVHRHNIWQRLGIAGNAELFRLFIGYLTKQQ